MFDPERDEDGGSRRFYLRLLLVVVVTVWACLALLPSVTAFSVGVDQGKGCLAVADGWHRDRPGLTKAERDAEATGFVGTRPSPAEEQLLEHADAYLTWRDGPGACVPESRHRLILSGIGLGGLGIVVGGVGLGRRWRRRDQTPPGAAGTDEPAVPAAPGEAAAPAEPVAGLV